jgi:aromatic-L-amino-acid decarboxylase
MDHLHRIDTAALGSTIKEDQEHGFSPWLVVASSGTTDTGAVDPISGIAAIVEKNGIWFHLDAVYGGVFLLCEEGRERMEGIERADSIVMDPHKGLGLPYPDPGAC